MFPPHPLHGFNLNFPNPAFLPVSPLMPGFHPTYPTPPPLLPHPPTHPQPPPPPTHQQLKCFMCPATFDKKEAFLYHLNFHSSYIDPAEAAKQGKIFFYKV